MIEKIKLKETFLHNRAEELPEDVWDAFVVPKYFHSHDLSKAKKSRVIVGGRGCGKTMYIRYFCHPTRFSLKRQSIELDELAHIGLYWRPHTQFCSLFSSKWLGNNARSSFLHYLSLILIVEFINSLSGIAKSKCPALDNTVLSLKIPKYFSKLIGDLNTDSTLSDLYDFCFDELDLLETWVNNPSNEIKGALSPLNSLSQLIRLLKLEYPVFENSMFHIFVDEFENLQAEQQKIFNDFIKHGKYPLIFSIAMKRYAKVETQTSGEEHVVGGQDFEKIDLEDSLSDSDFELLAAEVTLLRLKQSGIIDFPKDIDFNYLTDPNSTSKNYSEVQCKAIINQVSTIFPQPSLEQVSANLMGDKKLENTVLANLKRGLDKSKEKEIRPEDYLCSDARVTIAASSVINRKNICPKELKKEIEKYESGNPNKFEGDGGWIKSSLYGVILLVYKKYPKRSCPLYAGFRRYCRMSKKNIRHFQELLKHCIFNLEDEISELIFSPDLQSLAASQTSTMLLDEIVRFGTCGEQLQGLVKRLGFLFELSQKRISQSESEVNHFSLGESDEFRLSDNARFILSEAKRWSVLFEEKNVTKAKSESEIGTADYVLNPMYAPKFGISTRKNRKIVLSTNEIEILIQGSSKDWQDLVRRYAIRWDQLPEETTQEELF